LPLQSTAQLCSIAMIRHWRIRDTLGAQIGIAFFSVAAFAIVIGAYAAIQARSTAQQVAALVGTEWRINEIVGQLRNRIELNISRDILQVRVALGPYKGELQASYAKTRSEMTALRKQLAEESQRSALGAALLSLDRAEADFTELTQRLLRLRGDGDFIAADKILKEDYDAKKQAYVAALATLSAAVSAEALTITADIAQSSTSFQHSILAATLALILFSTVATIRLVRKISLPVRAVTSDVSAIASGQLGAVIAMDGIGEIKNMQSALHSMQRGLRSVVTTIRAASETTATSSAEIAQGNHDLSNRTEQQANAVQEAVLAMTDLSAMVDGNTRNAEVACKLAQDAHETATQGGAVFTDVVRTMHNISDSAQKISEIIGVIDSIAFQTNILALNAAVEAARAGESGRGFAVVAAEVRQLAQRCAEAAKEIKNLVSNSVGRAEEGTKLVEKAGTTINEIVSSISQVAVIISAIYQSTAKQNAEVTHVGAAVALIDRVTQQNAALVEELAAAASGLRIQANDLVRTVGKFDLGTVVSIGHHI